MKLNLRQLREGEGTPTVLLHGWMGCSADFEPLAADEAFDGTPIFAIDLPGHGESADSDAEYDFAEVAQWVADALPAPVVDLVGYSMGGRVALYVAGTQPSRIARLVLIGAHPGIEHPGDLRERLEQDAQRATELIEAPAGFVQAWSKLDLFGSAQTPAWRATLKRRAESADDRAFGWGRALICLSLGRQLSLWNVPYGLGVQTLYVVGTRDEKYIDVAREFKAQNPTVASVGLIVGAHHAPHLDRPDAVAARIASFFADAMMPDDER